MRASTGKARDAHRGPHEQRERQQRRSLLDPFDEGACRIDVIEGPGDERAEHERRDHATQRDGQRPTAFFANEARVELEADEKHEEDEAEIGELPQRDVRREEPLLQVGCDAAEDCGPQEDPRHDLADHGRLSDPPGGRPHRTRRSDDDREVEEEEEERMRSGHWRA